MTMFGVFSEYEGNEDLVCVFQDRKLAEQHSAQIGCIVRELTPLVEPPRKFTTYSAHFYSWLRPLAGDDSTWSYQDGYAEHIARVSDGPVVRHWENNSKTGWTISVESTHLDEAVRLLEMEVSEALGQTWVFADGRDQPKGADGYFTHLPKAVSSK